MPDLHVSKRASNPHFQKIVDASKVKHVNKRQRDERQPRAVALVTSRHRQKVGSAHFEGIEWFKERIPPQ